MITIEIDDKKIEVEPGKMIIQVTDDLGIHIPRFCYHKKLSIASNCRMCLVEVEKAPNPMPACATPVDEGMKIFTKSPRAIAAQKATMEFLLAAPRFTIELAGPRVIAYRSNRFDADEFEHALQVLAGIIDRLPNYLLREWKGAVR